MSYTSVELSVAEAQPYFLYAFDFGTSVTRLTSDADDLLKMSETWTASPIAHTDIEQTGNIEKASITLTFPLSDDTARLFLFPLGQVITVTVWRGHHTDLTESHRVVWKGRVVGAKTQGQAIEVEIESVFTSMRRPGCRARYQRTCRFALYSDGCTLDIADFQTPGTITAISGLVLTVGAASSAPEADYYKAGVIEWNGLFGFIIAHNGSSLTLLSPMPGLQAAFDLSASEAVQIAPGCNLSRSQCVSRFDNVLNFGGFPYMTEKNPFTIRIV